jgi:phosphoenolpyruvate-protein phosphotransferase (PTS system enzyme I)
VIRYPGIVASPGIATGRVFLYRKTAVRIARKCVTDSATEVERYRNCVKEADDSLSTLMEQMEVDGVEEQVEIFEIQREFLTDPSYGEAIAERIAETGLVAEAAVEDVSKELAEEFSAIDDEYFAGRSADILDLGKLLIGILTGTKSEGLSNLPGPSVVVADDLAPSDTAGIDRDKVLALCTRAGSATSHTAILARSFGIPALVGLGPIAIEPGTEVVVDAVGGALVVEPSPEELATFTRAEAKFQDRKEFLLRSAKEPAVTTDGHRVGIWANVGSVADARQALELGAEGSGLVRTEFLFLNRKTLPSEEEQYEVYRQIAEVFGKRPAIIRTLDVGGDKKLPSVDMPPEENPFLGRRAIRLALSDPERLLYPQIRAILRAGYGRALRMMFPMISSIEEIREAREAVEHCKEELSREGLDFDAEMPVGIMIEIPSAAIIADRLAHHVDFFSIGTNDLVQYTIAVDRTNDTVAHLADTLHPAVVSLIQRVIEGAHAAGKECGMCGEMAGDPSAIPLLLALGLDDFSMAPGSVPFAKDQIRRLSKGDLEQLKRIAVTATSREEIKKETGRFATGLLG